MDTTDYVLYALAILGMIIFAPFALLIVAPIYFIHLYHKKRAATA
jgi:hypothetical protein